MRGNITMRTTEETQRATKGGSVAWPRWPVTKLTSSEEVRRYVRWCSQVDRHIKEPSHFITKLESLQEGVR